jgi:hypothetical protein
MEREILFIGKRIDNGEWIYGYYSTSIEKGDNGGTECHYRETCVKLHYIDNILVYPKSVGQYIGFTTDDKLTKIFDKDIIQFEVTEDGKIFEDVKGEVEWLQESCRWIVRVVEEEGQYYYSIEGDTYLKCSILGNMIDNRGILEN